MAITAQRYHDICAGHRVVGHEGKCRNLHGHNYRIHFICEANSLDSVGRVVDFSVIKSTMCQFVEEEWDHRMILWENDPQLDDIRALDPTVCVVPFNPTAENLANYLLREIGPALLSGKGVTLTSVMIEETRKCSAGASL